MGRFQQRLPTFRLRFIGQEKAAAFCCCMLRTDLLGEGSGVGVYIEFEVPAAARHALAVQDLSPGGCGIVTFFPGSGYVCRTRQVRDVPGKVETASAQPLARLPNRRFEGSFSLYLYSGHLAFLRRCAADAAEQEARPWESTGFVTDLSWAEGRCLTPCFDYYHVKSVKVDSAPPFPVGDIPK